MHLLTYLLNVADQDCFIDNYITGRRLILVDASTLPQLGITNIDHIKVGLRFNNCMLLTILT